MSLESEVDERFRKLEAAAEKTDERLSALERDVALIKATMATKTDIAELRTEIAQVRTEIAEAKNSIIIWVVSAIFLAQLLPVLLKRFGL